MTYVLSVVIVVSIYCFTEALAVWLLWGWFVTPTFGIATPRLPVIAGLCIMVGLMTGHMSKQEEGWDLSKQLLHFMFTRPALAIAIGWVLKVSM